MAIMVEVHEERNWKAMTMGSHTRQLIHGAKYIECLRIWYTGDHIPLIGIPPV